MNKIKRLFIAIAILMSASASAQFKKTDIAKGHYEKTGETCFAGVSVEDRNAGLYVTEVFESLLSSGFHINDRITAIGTQKLNSVKEWDKAMKASKPGTKVQIQLEREGKTLSVEVELEKIDVYGKVI